MAHQACAGASLTCTFGTTPSTLSVLPLKRVFNGPPSATIMDHAPMLNILPFGMCNAPSNPMVIAATAAALGVPTPAPCVPATATPWLPGKPTILIGGTPALDRDARLMCMWGGMITMPVPGQLKVTDG